MPTTTPTIQMEMLHDLFQQLFDLSKSPGLSIGILQQRNPIHTNHFGVRAVNKPEVTDDDTLCNLASFTKLIAASIVNSLVHDVLVGWDTPTLHTRMCTSSFYL